ncbi:alpha/beta hydrolase [Sulfitobacter mediterraneus]|uniref:Alpha/beta hydrolase family protein n=1 Tax=Sulfitobacter mediterraneus TaxID=83219 RepID=A0A2T6CG94_9RHOB|nr:alpha/beta hydrolase [Sulfitobacter mediterraneus]KIN77597.1 Esterase/lipase [Sulfitobacter mediterraneus KCTC 32188]PTX74534.1 alpha/beta hydrolase family protein [Sulfitobacter mediterraneus]
MHDWDDAFNNMGHVEGSDALPGLWAGQAAAYRETVRVDTDLAYGPSVREKFDLIWPVDSPKGLVVFVHGGFWMRLDKSYWSHLAEGARAQGWAVAIPSYTLTPEARISEITKQIGTAIEAAASLVEGPIRLMGHSAGGHLVTRMTCDNTPLSGAILARIVHVLSISGLHDLRPLRHTAMNDTLHLTTKEATAESPALLVPVPGSQISVCVGGGERPEFIRQARLLDIIWNGLDAKIELTIEGDHNHFTLLEGLKSPISQICATLLKTKKQFCPEKTLF